MLVAGWRPCSCRAARRVGASSRRLTCVKAVCARHGHAFGELLLTAMCNNGPAKLALSHFRANAQIVVSLLVLSLALTDVLRSPSVPVASLAGATCFDGPDIAASAHNACMQLLPVYPNRLSVLPSQMCQGRPPKLLQHTAEARDLPSSTKGLSSAMPKGNLQGISSCMQLSRAYAPQKGSPS